MRVCALGPRRSGKTSALHVLSFNKAPGEYIPTDGIDSYTLFTSQDRRVILRLVDTPGDLGDCSPLASVLFDECDICILCSPDSASWMRFIRSHSDAHVIVLAPSNDLIPVSFLSLGTDLASTDRHAVISRPASPSKLRTILLDALLSYLPPPPSSSPQPSSATRKSTSIVYSQLHIDNDDDEEEDEDELDDNEHSNTRERAP